MSYEVPSGRSAWHMVAELPPRANLRVEVDGRRMGRVRSSTGGVAVFRDKATGKRTIRLLGE